MKRIKEAKRIVVKVGTSTLIYDNGKINLGKIDKIALVLSDLHNQGYEIALVSSGAIGIGVEKLKLEERPESIKDKQGIAAVGQCEMMHLYSKMFGDYNHVVAQILITKDVVDNKVTRKYAADTFEALFEKGIIPVVNENDTVSVDEINFGDNDALSATVAGFIGADMLIILSDIDGFYTADPRVDDNAKLIPLVDEITKEFEGNAGGVGSRRGTGGMITKLAAAKICIEKYKIPMAIVNGKDPVNVRRLLKGKQVGTIFIPKGGEI